jgi:hypothetical protein
MVRHGAATALLLASLGCGVMEGDVAGWLVQVVASTQDNFRHSRSVSVLLEPADLDLYRALLPDSFGMPTHPLVSFAIVDQLEVGPWPLTPYQLGNVNLRCVYQGEEGWHPITMPENQRVAIWSGRTMGFPKYMADHIALEQRGEGWYGEVRDDGEVRLALTFAPDPEALPDWQAANWEVGGPTFNLMPPGKGPEVRVIRSAPGKGQAESVVQPGWVRVEIGPSRPWAGVVSRATHGAGFQVEHRGGSSLAPDD